MPEDHLQGVVDFVRNRDRSAYQVVACQGSEPSEEDVAAFEADVGFRLPEEFRTFTMSSLGGLYIAVSEDLWPRPQAFDVGPFWSFLYGLKVFGIAEGIPEWLDIRAQYKKLSPDLVPFLQVIGDADCYCFDRDGRIIAWSHEEPDEREVLAMTFPELLLREIRELEERKEKKLAERTSAPKAKKKAAKKKKVAAKKKTAAKKKAAPKTAAKKKAAPKRK